MKNHRDYIKTKGVFSCSAVVAVMVYRCKQGKIYPGREPVTQPADGLWGYKAHLYVS